jgi:hypothetical protein
MAGMSGIKPRQQPIKNGERAMTENHQKSLYVEISEGTLKRLLAANHVCAADFRCLDCNSKHCLWRLCLESCSGRTGPTPELAPSGKVISWPGRSFDRGCGLSPGRRKSGSGGANTARLGRNRALR